MNVDDLPFIPLPQPDERQLIEAEARQIFGDEGRAVVSDLFLVGQMRRDLMRLTFTPVVGPPTEQVAFVDGFLARLEAPLLLETALLMAQFGQAQVGPKKRRPPRDKGPLYSWQRRDKEKY